VGAGVGVVAEVGVDTSGHLVEFGEDAVLLALEHGQRDRVGIVGLHESVLLAFEQVAVGRETREFFGFGGHQPVELVVEHPGEGGITRLPPARGERCATQGAARTRGMRHGAGRGVNGL